MKNKLFVNLFHLLLAAVPSAVLLSAIVSPAHEKVPDFSPKALLTGSTAQQTEALLTENFPGRSLLTSLHTSLELSSGRRETNGIFVLQDRLIENAPAVSEKEITRAAEYISSFSERFDGAVSWMLIPTASSIRRDLLPVYAEVAPQKAIIDKAYELASEKVGTIDCYSALASNRRNIYYRTDPHWTSLGAYMGYSACSNQMGFSPLSADRFDIEHASHSFVGSLCDRIGYTITPDTIDIYTPHGISSSATAQFYDGESWITHEDIYFRERLDEGYAVFPGGEIALTIETGLTAPDLLVMGDSYANALLPFFAMHYSKITLVDVAMPEKDLRELVDLNDYEQLLFCGTLISFAELS